MARKKQDNFKCSQCNKQVDNLYTLGFYLERYIPYGYWYCEKCFEIVKKEVDKKIELEDTNNNKG